MMNRRRFVQRLSAAAIVAQSVESVAKMFHPLDSPRCVSALREVIARARKGEIGEVTHVFGYSYGDGLREPLEAAHHHVDVANRIFGATPIAVFASRERGDDENIHALFTYPGERRMVFRSMAGSVQADDQLWIYGSKGSLNLVLQRRYTHIVTSSNLAAAMLATDQSLRASREIDIPGIG